MKKLEEGFPKEKSQWYNFSKTPKLYRCEVLTEMEFGLVFL